ncbi:MAG: FemAB family PEP-CTERM system-associated protein [Lamprocystis purpurea]|uniref:FemAB family XrtA/PEP-CTERM system-associated protein n=1 Tax=Lamprocystis purpurea TaxID=61598 RepID=UPI0003772CA2|nr:FemAB family PEP-CTERM system-associated protein [Lamprocystis purpurea]
MCVKPIDAIVDTGLRVRRYLASDHARWDAFVAHCAQATFFHRSGWSRVITEGLGQRCRYLLAERNGEIEGILPLAEVRSRLFGHALISTPCCVYGGVAAVSEDARQALILESMRLARRLGVDALEMRNREAVCPEWPTQNLYVTFRRPISEADADNFKSIPRKQRAMVRKAIDAGLSACVTNDLDRFYRIYSESVRNLGTPVFSRRFFAVLINEFHSDTELSVVAASGRDVAAVLSFYFRDEVLPYYGGSQLAARPVKGNDFMYWDLMRRAAARGVRVFDYGRSKVGTGPYHFKKNWGFVPQPLHYEYYLVRSRVIPENNPMNPRYRLLIAAWKWLPLSIANTVGPMLARHLG